MCLQLLRNCLSIDISLWAILQMICGDWVVQVKAAFGLLVSVFWIDVDTNVQLIW